MSMSEEKRAACTVISILLVCGQRRIQRAVTASYHGCTQIIRTERFPLGTSAVIGDIIASVIVGIAVGAVKPAVRADHWRIRVYLALRKILLTSAVIFDFHLLITRTANTSDIRKRTRDQQTRRSPAVSITRRPRGIRHRHISNFRNRNIVDRVRDLNHDGRSIHMRSAHNRNITVQSIPIISRSRSIHFGTCLNGNTGNSNIKKRIALQMPLKM